MFLIWILIFNGYKFVCLDLPLQLRHYKDKVHSRLKTAYRPSTTQVQMSAVVTLAMFCLFHAVSFPGVSIFTVLAFVKFLYDNQISVPTIKNYLSSIKSLFKLHNLHIVAFQSPWLWPHLVRTVFLRLFPSPYFHLPSFWRVNHTLNFPLHLFYKISFIFVFFCSPPNFKRGPGL
jgi:hypothetical protein